MGALRLACAQVPDSQRERSCPYCVCRRARPGRPRVTPRARSQTPEGASRACCALPSVGSPLGILITFVSERLFALSLPECFSFHLGPLFCGAGFVRDLGDLGQCPPCLPVCQSDSRDREGSSGALSSGCGGPTAPLQALALHDRKRRARRALGPLAPVVFVWDERLSDASVPRVSQGAWVEYMREAPVCPRQGRPSPRNWAL